MKTDRPGERERDIPHRLEGCTNDQSPHTAAGTKQINQSCTHDRQKMAKHFKSYHAPFAIPLMLRMKETTTGHVRPYVKQSTKKSKNVVLQQSVSVGLPALDGLLTAMKGPNELRGSEKTFNPVPCLTCASNAVGVFHHDISVKLL